MVDNSKRNLGFENSVVDVNLSFQQLRTPDFLENMKHITAS